MAKAITHKLKAMTFSLYITQYLGVAFFFAASLTILRQQGISLDKLALINVAAFPMAFKVLYAPLIDRRRLGVSGQYRSWLLVAQGSMALMLAAIGCLDIQQSLNNVLILLALYCLAMAVQDVAIDGLACKMFAANQRQVASSLQFSGNLIGNVLGGGVILMFYDQLGWQYSLWIMAALTLLSWLQLLVFNEPDSVAATQAVKTRALLRECVAFFRANKRWICLLCVYPLASNGAFAIVSPALVDAGWSLADIGFVTRVYGPLVGVFAALLTALLIKRWGRTRTLTRLTYLMLAALVSMLPMVYGNTSNVSVYVAITLYFCAFPALLATFGTLMMDHASGSDHKATYFTLQFSVLSFMGFVYAGICMALAQYWGYATVVMISMAAIPLCVSLIHKQPSASE